jgi:hypothetical protein
MISNIPIQQERRLPINSNVHQSLQSNDFSPSLRPPDIPVPQVDRRTDFPNLTLVRTLIRRLRSRKVAWTWMVATSVVPFPRKVEGVKLISHESGEDKSDWMEANDEVDVN